MENGSHGKRTEHLEGLPEPEEVGVQVHEFAVGLSAFLSHLDSAVRGADGEEVVVEGGEVSDGIFVLAMCDQLEAECARAPKRKLSARLFCYGHGLSLVKGVSISSTALVRGDIQEG